MEVDGVRCFFCFIAICFCFCPVGSEGLWFIARKSHYFQDFCGPLIDQPQTPIFFGGKKKSSRCSMGLEYLPTFGLNLF